jgi:hypothetical protein
MALLAFVEPAVDLGGGEPWVHGREPCHVIRGQQRPPQVRPPNRLGEGCAEVSNEDEVS